MYGLGGSRHRRHTRGPPARCDGGARPRPASCAPRLAAPSHLCPVPSTPVAVTSCRSPEMGLRGSSLAVPVIQGPPGAGLSGAAAAHVQRSWRGLAAMAPSSPKGSRPRPPCVGARVSTQSPCDHFCVFLLRAAVELQNKKVVLSLHEVMLRGGVVKGRFARWIIFFA